MAISQDRIYTTDDIYALPDGERAELIDGNIYYMALPSRKHQKSVHFLDRTIGNYIQSKNGVCEVYPAPFAVFLNENDKTCVEPDISVICDKNKNRITVWNFEEASMESIEEYSLSDRVRTNICEGFEIDFSTIDIQ